jgi:hypothetical protein
MVAEEEEAAGEALVTLTPLQHLPNPRNLL